MNRVLLCLLLSLRAIIIRSGEVIPMSAEFTPESERQRLQFLVRKNLSQLLSSKHSCQILAELASPPVETPAMLSSVSLTRPALCASLIDYGIVFPIPRARQSSSLSVFFFSLIISQAYMQPHLLGNEFTHLEFPRRVQRKEVGKRMLYRDFTMSGWWVN